MHLLNMQCRYKAYKDDKSNFVFKRVLFAKFTQPMLPSVGGFAISSDGYCLEEKNIAITLAHLFGAF